VMRDIGERPQRDQYNQHAASLKARRAGCSSGSSATATPCCISSTTSPCLSTTTLPNATYG
jgi:hypothetical protein